MFVDLRFLAAGLGVAIAATDPALPDNEAVSYHGVSFPKVIGGGRLISAQDGDMTELAGLGFEAF